MTSVNEDHVVLAKNVFYSFLNTYGQYFFSIFTAFIIARLISKDIWGFFIIAYSFIMLIAILVDFFPPGLSYSLHYFIPSLLIDGNNEECKSIIRNAVLVRTLIAFIAFFIFSSLTLYIPQLFSLNLMNYTNFLTILSPLILIGGIGSVLNAVLRGYNKFNFIFISLLIQNGFLLSFFFYFLFFLPNVAVEAIVLVNTLSAIFPFFLKLFYVIKLYSKIQVRKSNKSSIKNFLSKTIKYGTPLSIGIGLLAFWKELQLQLLGIFEKISMVTGFMISRNYTTIASSSSQALTFPLTTTFSRLIHKNEQQQVVKIYNLTFKYSLFILQLISGILIFLADVFLIIVYGESYLIFSFLVKISFFIIIFQALEALLGAILNATNQVKYSPFFVLIYFSFNIPLFIIGLTFYGIYGAVFGLIISAICELIIQIYFSYKIGKIKINTPKILIQYLVFFLSLAGAYFINQIIRLFFNFDMALIFNSLILQELELIPIILFIVLFFILNLLFKTFTNKDKEYLYTYFNKDKISHSLMRKILRLFELFK